MKEDNEIKNQYSTWAHTYDKDKIKLFERDGINYNEFMREFTKQCELKSGMNILDVGIGTGLTSISIANVLNGNCKIMGIEPVIEMIQIAKENLQNEGFEKIIQIKKGEGESILSDNESYDLVVSTFAMRHMNIEKALKEFKRVLKKEGKLVIADICAPPKWRKGFGKVISFFAKFAISQKKKHRGESKSTLLTVEEWRALLEKLGIHIDDVIEFPSKKDPEWRPKRVILSMRK